MNRLGVYGINRKRVQRLMRLMGLVGIAPGPGISHLHPAHSVYPYLLRNLVIERPNQVWCSDITYVPMPVGFMYLVVIMDGFSRYVLAWELSNSLEVGFCLVALEQALARQPPEIFNSDQGAQFTSPAFHYAAGASSGVDQHGWPRADLRQYLCGAALADREV